MPCYRPKQVLDCGLKPNGKRQLVFLPKVDYVWPIPEDRLHLPCGYCLGCRIDHARTWALRCEHEAKFHKENSFITLTYSNEYLPEDRSLNVKHFQDFMKRLRYFLGDKKIRYFYCGEYGDKLLRPHFHAIVFGHAFDDKKLWKRTKSGCLIYRSQLLEKAWTFGFSSVGDMTFQSAGYVARYALKKVKKSKREDHYTKLCKETGEIFTLAPEFSHSSNRFGIGYDYYKKYKDDIYKDDFIISEGSGFRRFRVPRYYDKRLEVDDPNRYASIKAQRVENASKHVEDNSFERLLVREKVHLARIRKLHREFEEQGYGA